jgi:hypothetical protein
MGCRRAWQHVIGLSARLPKLSYKMPTEQWGAAVLIGIAGLNLLNTNPLAACQQAAPIQTL